MLTKIQPITTLTMACYELLFRDQLRCQDIRATLRNCRKYKNILSVVPESLFFRKSKSAATYKAIFGQGLIKYLFISIKSIRNHARLPVKQSASPICSFFLSMMSNFYFFPFIRWHNMSTRFLWMVNIPTISLCQILLLRNFFSSRKLFFAHSNTVNLKDRPVVHTLKRIE